MDRAILEKVASAGAAGLVVKANGPLTESLRDHVRASGLTVVVISPAASWFQLGGLLRERIGLGQLTAPKGEQFETIPSDLFDIANAISALVSAPVTIEDRDSRVIAFSRHQADADPARIATILGQAVPERYRTVLDTEAMIAELNATRDPVYFDLGAGISPRLAIAVRSGDEVLGSLWAAVDGPPSPQRVSAFAESAQVVAIALLRKRYGAEAGRRLRADLLGTLITGGVDAPEARSRLGLDGTAMRVLALELDRFEDSEAAESAEGEAARLRFTDAFALHLNAISPHSAAVLIGPVAYGVLPLAPGAEQSDLARQVAESFVRRVGGLTPNVGIGRVADTVEELVRSRRDADRALRVLRAQGHTGRVCQVEDALLDVMLLSLRDFLRAEVIDDVTAPVHRLLEYDQQNRTQLVPTLAAYLECSTDVAQASAALNVHPNTLRYRLRRCAEIGEIDLADPSQRLEAWIHLRMARLQD